MAYDRIALRYDWLIERYILQRGAGGRAGVEPVERGATLKNFFLKFSPQTPKLKIYIFLTLMHLNAVDWTCDYIK